MASVDKCVCLGIPVGVLNIYLKERFSKKIFLSLQVAATIIGTGGVFLVTQPWSEHTSRSHHLWLGYTLATSAGMKWVFYCWCTLWVEYSLATTASTLWVKTLATAAVLSQVLPGEGGGPMPWVPLPGWGTCPWGYPVLS